MRKQIKIINKVKCIVSKKVFDNILEIIEESEYTHDYCITKNEPSGELQSDVTDDLVQYWVDQWSSGQEADNFEGIVSIKISKDEYLEFKYSM